MTIEQYLKEHSLKESHVKSLGWVWEKDGSTITIPVYDADAKKLFCRYRHLKEGAKFSQDKGSHPSLYCVHKIKKEQNVIFCEGEPDAARLWQEGIPTVTGTSGVKTFSVALAKPLKGKNVAIVLDNDEGGRSSLYHYFKILKDVGAIPTIIQLPEKYKDVSDYFTAGFNKKAFQFLPRYSMEEYKEANEPKEFEWQTAEDILEKKLPEEKWLVDKIIPTEGFSFFVGPEASAKSFYALLIAKCVTTGEPWLNQFLVTKKTNVLFIDKENTLRRIQDRLRGLEIKSDNISWLEYPQYLEIADRESKTESGYTEFIESIARKVKKQNIGLVILDSFTDVFVGEENNRGDVQKFFDAMRQLFPNVAILALHHAGKMQIGVKRPTSQMARGSTNIMAQAYTAFHTEPVRKSKTEFTIEQTKAGDSERMNKFLVETKTILDPLHDGETLVTGFEYKGEVQDKEEKLQVAIELFEEAMAGIPRMPRKELQEQLKAEGVSPATFGRVIKEFKEEGRIKMEKSTSVKRGMDIVLLQGSGDIFHE